MYIKTFESFKEKPPLRIVINKNIYLDEHDRWVEHDRWDDDDYISKGSVAELKSDVVDRYGSLTYISEQDGEMEFNMRDINQLSYDGVITLVYDTPSYFKNQCEEILIDLIEKEYHIGFNYISKPRNKKEMKIQINCLADGKSLVSDIQDELIKFIMIIKDDYKLDNKIYINSGRFDISAFLASKFTMPFYQIYFYIDM